MWGVGSVGGGYSDFVKLGVARVVRGWIWICWGWELTMFVKY